MVCATKLVVPNVKQTDEQYCFSQRAIDNGNTALAKYKAGLQQKTGGGGQHKAAKKGGSAKK